MHIKKANHVLWKFYPELMKSSEYIYFMQRFWLTSNQLPEIQLGLCNLLIFSNIKTLESADLRQLFTDGRKVLTAKVKSNIVDFWLFDKFNATVINPVVSGK